MSMDVPKHRRISFSNHLNITSGCSNFMLKDYLNITSGCSNRWLRRLIENTNLKTYDIRIHNIHYYFTSQE